MPRAVASLTKTMTGKQAPERPKNSHRAQEGSHSVGGGGGSHYEKENSMFIANLQEESLRIFMGGLNCTD
jgi:hypothetical protein